MSGPLRDPAPEDPDLPGVAGERTDLAWSRTGLSVVVCAAAIFKKVWEHFDGRAGRVAVFSALAVGGVAWSLSMRWGAHAARTTAGRRHVADERSVRHLMFGTLAFAVAALLLSI